jgi:hypothetical protein
VERKLHLIVEEGNMNRLQHEMCEGETYDFYGKQLTYSGTFRYYTYSMTSTICDSVVELTLNVINTILVKLDSTFCWRDLPKTIGDVTYYPGYPEGYQDVVQTFVTDLGCDSIISTLVYIDDCVGTDDAQIRKLTIYPNPSETNGVVYVDVELSAEEKQGLLIDVISTSGKVLRTVYPNSYPIEIDGFNTSGVYILQMRTGTNEIIYGKLIVQ